MSEAGRLRDEVRRRKCVKNNLIYS